jgi:hypothetical protein
MQDTSPDQTPTRPRRRRRGAALLAAAFFAPAVAAVVPIAATSAGAAPATLTVVGDLATVDTPGGPAPLNDPGYAFGTGADFASIRAAITAGFGPGKTVGTAITIGPGVSSPTQLAASGANVYVTAARPDFTPAEVTALHTFVTSGGSVILLGNSNQTNASNPTTAFGFDLSPSVTYEATCTYTPPNPAGTATAYDLVGPNIPGDATANATDFVPRSTLHPGSTAAITEPLVGATAPFGPATDITAQHTVTTLSTIPSGAVSVLDYGVTARAANTFSTACPANTGTPGHLAAPGTWTGLGSWATALPSAPTVSVIPHGVYGGNGNSGVVIATSDTDTFSNAYDFDASNRALGLNMFAYIANSIPDPASRFSTIATPTRILDTRTSSNPLAAGETRSIQVTGVAGVPANATKVAINVTADAPTASGYITVHNSATTYSSSNPPATSSVSFIAGTTNANFVMADLTADGKIKLYNAAGTTTVLVDVVGYSAPAATGDAGMASVAPTRVLDTRDGTGGTTGTIGTGGTDTVQVTGVAGVPAGAKAVVANITAVDPTATSYLTAFATGGTAPNVSNVNYAAGRTTANYSVVPLSLDGKMSIYSYAGNPNVLVDVVGYYATATTTTLTTVTPVRALTANADSSFGPEDIGSLTLRGSYGIPAGATAVIVNVTAQDPTANAYLTVYPTSADPAPPNASTVNFYAGQTKANLALVKLGTDGGINIFNAAGTTGVLIDVVGYVGPA